MMMPETNPDKGTPPPMRQRGLRFWNSAATARLAAACQGKASPMPSIAAKLSWKEMRPSRRGSKAVITTALPAKAGSRLDRGRPKASAPK